MGDNTTVNATGGGHLPPTYVKLDSGVYCKNRPCGEGACTHSVSVGNIAACYDAVAANPDCGSYFSYGTDGWCDCVTKGKPCDPSPFTGYTTYEMPPPAVAFGNATTINAIGNENTNNQIDASFLVPVFYPIYFGIGMVISIVFLMQIYSNKKEKTKYTEFAKKLHKSFLLLAVLYVLMQPFFTLLSYYLPEDGREDWRPYAYRIADVGRQQASILAIRIVTMHTSFRVASTFELHSIKSGTVVFCIARWGWLLHVVSLVFVLFWALADSRLAYLPMELVMCAVSLTLCYTNAKNAARADLRTQSHSNIVCKSCSPFVLAAAACGFVFLSHAMEVLKLFTVHANMQFLLEDQYIYSPTLQAFVNDTVAVIFLMIIAYQTPRSQRQIHRGPNPEQGPQGMTSLSEPYSGSHSYSTLDRRNNNVQVVSSVGVGSAISSSAASSSGSQPFLLPPARGAPQALPVNKEHKDYGVVRRVAVNPYPSQNQEASTTFPSLNAPNDYDPKLSPPTLRPPPRGDMRGHSAGSLRRKPQTAAKPGPGVDSVGSESRHAHSSLSPKSFKITASPMHSPMQSKVAAARIGEISSQSKATAPVHSPKQSKGASSSLSSSSSSSSSSAHAPTLSPLASPRLLPSRPTLSPPLRPTLSPPPSSPPSYPPPAPSPRLSPSQPLPLASTPETPAPAPAEPEPEPEPEPAAAVISPGASPLLAADETSPDGQPR